MSTQKQFDVEFNRDPITGTIGSHPVGVGVGATVAGAASGALGGAVGGPIGAVAGAAIGAVLGGLAGKATAEEIYPTGESEYWREHFASRPYGMSVYGFEEYEPAYRYGWESFKRYDGEDHSFSSFEDELGRGWDAAKGQSKLVWHEAKDATKDAWSKVHRTAYGDRRNNPR